MTAWHILNLIENGQCLLNNKMITETLKDFQFSIVVLKVRKPRKLFAQFETLRQLKFPTVVEKSS